MLDCLLEGPRGLQRELQTGGLPPKLLVRWGKYYQQVETGGDLYLRSWQDPHTG